MTAHRPCRPSTRRRSANGPPTVARIADVLDPSDGREVDPFTAAAAVNELLADPEARAWLRSPAGRTAIATALEAVARSSPSRAVAMAARTFEVLAGDAPGGSP
jgi:hypothetical protein